MEFTKIKILSIKIFFKLFVYEVIFQCFKIKNPPLNLIHLNKIVELIIIS